MLRLLGSLVMFICLASALVGCGSSAGGRSHGRTLIVLDRSIGGVELRERRSEVERLLGRGTVLRTRDRKPPEPRLHIEDVLYANGLQVQYVSRGGSSRAQGRVVVLFSFSPSFRTNQGVGVGSTAAELRAVKGVRCGNLLNLDCQHGGRRHNQAGTFFELDGPDGKIVRVAIAYAD